MINRTQRQQQENNNKRGRKPGKSRIATDTPEKEAIRKGKKPKNSKTIRPKHSANLKPLEKTKKFCKAKQKIVYDSDSESKVNALEDDADTDDGDLLETINAELAEAQEELEFERPSFKNGDYVLVQFQKKQGATELCWEDYFSRLWWFRIPNSISQTHWNEQQIYYRVKRIV